jgi:hypothetical protein
MTNPSVLTTLTDEKIAAQHKTMSRDSLRWLMKRIVELRNPLAMVKPLTREKERFTRPNDRQKFMIGAMYFFVYDPKGKDSLPYYDRFPLVIPLKREGDGFMGLNIHYLPLKMRVLFMRKLLPLAIYNDDDEIKRLRVTYPILDATMRYKEFRPCVRKYLYSHMRSRILKVEPIEWDVAMHLPIQQFKKAKPQEIWQETVQEIRNS